MGLFSIIYVVVYNAMYWIVKRQKVWELI